MKSMNYIRSFVFLLIISSCNAQIKNNKTEKVKVYGNCNRCKSTIEMAGNKKNEAEVNWDKETKMAFISYDSLKTSSSEIVKRIALSGYDSAIFSAPNDTYSSLPTCCQYERVKKEISSIEKPERLVNHSKHQGMGREKMHQEEAEPKQEIKHEMLKKDNLKLVFDAYFEVKNSLVKSDNHLTSLKAIELIGFIENVKMNELEDEVHVFWMKQKKILISEAKEIAKSKETTSQRVNFMSLSTAIYTLLKVAKYQVPVYYQFCPMANKGKGANWLSTEEAIENPYYGSAMLSCGQIVETIK